MATGGPEDSNSHSIQAPGNAVFIVNIEPNGDRGDFEFNTRVGAGEDVGSLQIVFIENLGFEWINSTKYWHQNLPLHRWDHRKGNIENINQPDKKDCCLLCHIQSLDHSGAQGFVLAISSHGRELTETEIIFSDGRSLRLTEILEALNDENCPTLKGVPRIIILQVCRSNFEDKERVDKMQCHGVYLQAKSSAGIPVEDNQTITQDTGSETATDGNAGEAASGSQLKGRFNVKRTEDVAFQHIALHKMPQNFLLVYPGVSGQLSHRNKTDGSWLLDGFKRVITTEFASQQPINFFHLLTSVSRYIATEKETIRYMHDKKTGGKKKDEKGKCIIDPERSGLKNAVCFHHKLLQPLIFSPKMKDEPSIPEINIDLFKGKKKRKNEN